MKEKILLSLLLLTFSLGFGQNYQPFYPNDLHYFATTSANYSVRIDSIGLSGSDSSFWLNPVFLPPSPACVQSNQTHYLPSQEGFFGDHFIRRPNGVFQFVGSNGDTISFQTSASQGTTWPFLSGSTLTATMTQRSTVTVGNTLDSLILITVSDGQQFAMTQHHGFQQATDLRHYFAGSSAITFTQPEPPSIPSYKDYIGWQMGDLFRTVDHSNSGAGYTFHNQYVVLARTDSPDGDSVMLQMKHYGVQFWWPNDTIILPVDTLNFVYRKRDFAFLTKATFEYCEVANHYYIQQPYSYTTSAYVRRNIPITTFWSGAVLDSCGYGFQNVLATPCLDPYTQHYATGLGKAYATYSIGNTITSCIVADYNLVCYEQASSDSLGNCPSAFLLLSRPMPQQSLEMQVQRHSQTGALSITWQSIPAGNYLWEYYDLNGKLLKQEKHIMHAQGSQEVPSLGVAGMYLLRIQDTSGKASKTLRLPMLRN
jgi:hypothetical protein